MRTDHLTLDELERHTYIIGDPLAGVLGTMLDRDKEDLDDARGDVYQEGYDEGYEAGYEAGEDDARSE